MSTEETRGGAPTLWNFTTPLGRLDVEQLALVPDDGSIGLPTTRGERLVRLGLVERDAENPGQVRRTKIGQEVVLHFQGQGWIP
jgi:hypothetical protein